jgi:selT/selW/selH-like putative selenoprotein
LILSRAPRAEVRLRKSRGGAFEITVEGRLRFSKKSAGRFPTGDEVLASVA